MASDGSTECSGHCINSVVRDHHVYKNIWTPEIGEELTCRREVGNIHDLHAVAIIHGSTVVGHVPRTISMPCNVFIRRGGMIRCIITGHRQYSLDLERGGLDVPCKLQFEGSQNSVDQLLEKIHSAPVDSQSSSVPTSTSNQPPLNSKLCKLRLLQIELNCIIVSNYWRWGVLWIASWKFQESLKSYWIF